MKVGSSFCRSSFGSRTNLHMMCPVLLCITLLFFPTDGSAGAAKAIYDDVQVKDDTVMLQVTQKVYRFQAVRSDQPRNTASSAFNGRENASKSVIDLSKSLSLSLSPVLAEVSSAPGIDCYAGTPRMISTLDILSFCLAIASICLTILVYYRWKNSSIQELKHDVGRAALLDNAKALAMFCVIFQHMFDFDYSRGPADVSQQIVRGMRILDMPMFSFVSGLCSQQPPTAKRIRGLITNIALPAVIQISLVEPVLIDSLDHPSQLSENILGFFRFRTLTNIFHLQLWPWYLVALLVWRAFSFIMYSVHLQFYTLVTCVLISCIGGYLQVCSYNGDHYINSTIGYWAYFAIGYALPFDAIMKRVLALSPSTRFAAAVGALLWIIGTVMPNIFSLLPAPHHSYCTWLYIHGQHYMLQSTSFTCYLSAWRLTKISLDIEACLLWLLFVIPREETVLTQAGKYSLYAYLHHRIGKHVYVTLTQILYGHGTSSSQLSELAVCAVMDLATLLLVTSWPWRKLFSWAVEPTWANPLIKRLIPDSDGCL
mmetsp:Transcript_163126/g.313327  ORF Transcript_163126/g.313327 Transcript_163126/m.313327 type:complete len:540 (+) Transcript_163126:3-1622(+)